jgi:hypothetical protein
VNELIYLAWFASSLGTASPAHAQEQEDDGEVCRRARASVVRVEVAGGVGAGFVVGDGTMVATAFHVVESGRAVTVALSGGETLDAEILAVDDERDLALLSVERRIADPLELRNGAEIGEQVYAIGHPFSNSGPHYGDTEGLLDWSVSRGIVSAVGPVNLQTDAALNPGNSGGPVIGRDGRVIGVAVSSSGSGVGMAVRSEHLSHLVDDRSLHEGYSGEWSFHIGVGAAFDFSEDGPLIGPSVSLELDYADKLAFTLTAAYLFGGDETDALLDVDRQAFTADLMVQYRILLPIEGFPLYLVPGVGVGLSYVNARTSRLELQGSPGCDISAMRCGVDAFVSTSERERWSVRPEASLGLEIGNAVLSYTFALDVADPSLSTHRIGLGFRF